MKTNTYIDNLETQNMSKIEVNGYIGYFYEDYFMDEWVGNFNLIKDNKSLLHATLTKMPTDLKEFTKSQIEFIEFYEKIR